MPEPIDPTIPCPIGGWPRAAVRLDLDAGVRLLTQAAYELACYSRLHRTGCVATFLKADLYAYPHQSTAEIERGYVRMRDMEDAGLARSLIPKVGHWTALRKIGLVAAVAEGFVQRSDVLAQYALSEEEFSSWERRLAAHGRDGLEVSNIQRCPAPPAMPMESAA